MVERTRHTEPDPDRTHPVYHLYTRTHPQPHDRHHDHTFISTSPHAHTPQPTTPLPTTPPHPLIHPTPTLDADRPTHMYGVFGLFVIGSSRLPICPTPYTHCIVLTDARLSICPMHLVIAKSPGHLSAGSPHMVLTIQIFGRLLMCAHTRRSNPGPNVFSDPPHAVAT